MRWVRDTTGRFLKRPHYSPEDLDFESERIVSEFLFKKYGQVVFPITTNDLTCLLERDVASLDLYSDFSDEEGQIEGVTEFRVGHKPTVKVAARLTENSNLENRLRTTLTHEYGHVRFHDLLYQVDDRPASLFEDTQTLTSRQANRCNRDSMFSNDGRDWMEWQAGFVCGAMLMPVKKLLDIVRAYRMTQGIEHAAISEQSAEGIAIIDEISRVFQTSRDAARVRLLQKKILNHGSEQSFLK